MCVTRHDQSTQNKKSAYIFACINTKVFYKMIVLLWVYVARHVQSTQSSKFAMSFQYVQKSMRDEVDFVPADNHERFLQGDSITLGVHSQACSKYPKQQICNIFPISQGKHEG